MDIVTYAVAKKYVNETVVGGGALKGKNCTIQNITPITGGNRVTFKWTLDDGTELTNTLDVMNGIDGLGIKSVAINEQQHLIITYNDDTTQDAGEISGGGGEGEVISVNGKKGIVVLNANDVNALPSNTPLFSGDYDDLSNKPTIPTKLSDLINDTNFITNTVNNLLNYYSKSETYTKEEINNAIGAIATVHFEAVEELPVTDIQTNVIYLVPNEIQSQQNIYDEYLYIDEAWELIGSTQIDLSNYIQKSQTSGLVKNDGSIDTTQYISQHQDISGKQDADDKMTQTDMQDIFSVLPVARNNYQKYSTQEQIIGEWINGKPLYQKTIEFGTLPNNTEKQVSAGVADLDMIYNGYGIYTNGTDTVNLLSHPWPTEASIDVLAFKKVSNDWNISITTKSNRTGYTGYITLQYTKTTD